MLRNYEGSLEDFAMANVILPNNVMTLQWLGDAK
jgi:hypothetical protein